MIRAMRLVATYAGILENLGESRVDVDGRGDVVDGGIEIHVGGDLLDDVGRMGTIGSTAENLARDRKSTRLNSSHRL